MVDYGNYGIYNLLQILGNFIHMYKNNYQGGIEIVIECNKTSFIYKR